MSTFEAAIGTVLHHEGGWANSPADSGGKTKYGISQASYPDLDIAALTLAGAIEIYRRDYWRFGAIVDQAVATKVFDLAVVCGPGSAVRMLQRACAVEVDGLLGPGTLAAANVAGAALLFGIVAAAEAHFRAIVAAKPGNAVWLDGWLIRAQDLTIYPPPPGVAVLAEAEAPTPAAPTLPPIAPPPVVASARPWWLRAIDGVLVLLSRKGP